MFEEGRYFSDGAEFWNLQNAAITARVVTTEAFARLLTLPDKQVMEIAAMIMADALMHGSGIVEILGSVLGVDMGEWSSDDTFFDLGPRQGRHARYGPEDGRSGRSGRQRHDDSTGKVLKEIIRDALSSENGRNKKEGWFAFPFAAYRTTEGISLVAATKRVAEHFKPETR